MLSLNPLKGDSLANSDMGVAQQNLKNSSFPRKSSFKYILLSNFAFLVIFKSISARETACFWHRFHIVRVAWSLFASFNSLHHNPLPGHSSYLQSAHQAVFKLLSWSLALFKWRHGTSDYGHRMTSSIPLSFGHLESHNLGGRGSIWLSKLSTGIVPNFIMK